jgi:ribosomal protein L37E
MRWNKMARTCQNCGQKLRARDKYCSECGVPVGHVATSPQAREWEYCEVIWSARGFLANDKSYFCARDIVTGHEVLRSNGAFQAREVTEMRAYPADDRRTHAVLDEFTDQLKDAGWELLNTRGSGWWSQRFRRKIVG